MAFNFPNSPTDGQTFTPYVGGPTYVWSAAETAWMFASPAAPPVTAYVQKAGDTMTGNLTISGASLGVTGPVSTGALSVSGTVQASSYNNVLPDVTNTRNLGSAAQRWGTVYASVLDLAGGINPGGRLTTNPNDPRPSNAEAFTKIYYVPYLHGYVSVPASASTVITMPIPLAGVLNDYTDATTNPAAISTTVASHFGLFLWNNNGVLTLSRGPANNCNTGGAVAPACTLAFGPNNLVVNSVAITNGPAAKMGLYVGTAFAWTTGVSYMRTGSANGGNVLGLANYYNRLTATSILAYGVNTSLGSRVCPSVMYACIANAGNNDLQRFSATWGFSGAGAAAGIYSGVFLFAGVLSTAQTPSTSWYTISTQSQGTSTAETVSCAPNLQNGAWRFDLGVTDGALTTITGWGRSTTEFSIEL